MKLSDIIELFVALFRKTVDDRKKAKETANKKPEANPKVTSSPVTAPATGPLIDPPYDPAGPGYNPGWEDVGVESTLKIIFRGFVFRPSCNGWWSLSTPFMKHVRNVNGQTVCDQDFVEMGVVWHCRGWMAGEPKEGDANPTIIIAGPSAPIGTKFSVWEVRQAK